VKGQGPLATERWLSHEILCFSGLVWGQLEENAPVRLNEPFLMKSGWQARRELGQTQQSFPGDSIPWKTGSTFFATHVLWNHKPRLWGGDLCHCKPSTLEWKSISPPVRTFVCMPYLWPHFKMHFEVWANKVNDIQWDCQMLVISSHFQINVGPPVMNWKLNKHISFN
jgi:hypothetical protein